MKLLLDIGNTRLKVAGTEGKGFVDSVAIEHAGGRLTEALEEVASRHAPEEIWVACVAGPQLQEAVQCWADERWGLEPRFVSTTAQACGVVNAYAQPENLGVDRWLAVIAAHRRGQGAVCVVDAGTCLTVDVVDASGRHLGGLIAPGVNNQRAAVWGRTQVRARMQDCDLMPLADNTDDAVGFGTLHSSLGLIERVLAQLETALPIERRLLTGGEAALLLPYLTGWEQVPDLVLEGLAALAQSESPPAC